MSEADDRRDLNAAWADYGQTQYGKRTAGLLLGQLVERTATAVWRDLDAKREARLNARAEDILAHVRGQP